MKYLNIGQLTPALAVTYTNALLGVAGIISAQRGDITLACILLVVAILCDVFDGVIARNSKQTQDDQVRGTIADTVADMISFGVLPVVILLTLVSPSPLSLIAAGLYVAAAIHRLVVFTEAALESRKLANYYTGLPVAIGAALFPICYALGHSLDSFGLFLQLLTICLAVLFVSKLPIKKTHGLIAYTSYVIIAALTITGLLLW